MSFGARRRKLDFQLELLIRHAHHENFMRLLEMARVPDSVDAEFEDVKVKALVEGEG